MNAQHTPGPWKHDSTWGIIKHGKTEICALHSGNLANANLIASAPELLSALEDALEELKHAAYIVNLRQDVIDQCKAVLAKAKGVIE
jgi:hypothetical protein